LSQIQPPSAAPSSPSDPEAGFSRADGWWTQQASAAHLVYWGLHAACLLAFVVGVTRGDLLLCAATFVTRMFGITGGYHRYFAHKTYKTSRAFQFVLAFLACSATQKGPLWWAGHHRGHHKYADRDGDVHSPREGLFYSHQGWIFDRRWDATPLERIPEFAAYPELVWLNRYYQVPPVLLAVLCFAIGGFSGLFWGFLVSTVLLWHATYTINSLCHIWGTRRYATPDTSRNNVLLALLTLGEGWHNNHHHYCASTRQGFRWWEIDVTYYLLRGLQAVGLVWDIREPPAHILAPHRAENLRKAA
jgi:stearoyl-CoA desaturase (delta-9 desaturase)